MRIIARNLMLRVMPAALIAVTVGCGKGEPRGDVVGEVTFDEKPVETGMVSFEPTEATAPPRSVPIQNGKYRAAGMGLEAGHLSRADHRRRPVEDGSESGKRPTCSGAVRSASAAPVEYSERTVGGCQAGEEHVPFPREEGRTAERGHRKREIGKDQPALGSAPEWPPKTEYLPAKYNSQSELEITIVPGERQDYPGLCLTAMMPGR